MTNIVLLIAIAAVLGWGYYVQIREIWYIHYDDGNKLGPLTWAAAEAFQSVFGGTINRDK